MLLSSMLSPSMHTHQMWRALAYLLGTAEPEQYHANKPAQLSKIPPHLGYQQRQANSYNPHIESPPDFSTFLLPAIRNLHLSLRDLGIRKISVSTTFSFISVITTPFPPSSAQFLEPALDTVVRPLLQFLRDTNSSFLVNLYPYNLYKIRSEIPIGFPLFQEHPFGFRDDLTTGVRYRNLFDMMVDAVISAMAVAGYENIPLIVTETGWPSFSTDPTEIDANPVYAELYLKGLLCHLRSGKGTPLRKEGVSETYIYELLDKQMRKGRNWGILYPNLTAKYKYIQFSGSYCRGFFDMLIMAVGQFLVFAFLRGNGSFSLL
ncbi:glucan endo-1 3-beta-glucosidase 2 [Prunus yedoensis var. nudiflora]|uniref:glucan endo-1,3-beta-D-glucosidase n=1 Tax=Prunus yedoensis var. nudiflora TaxID=2094558 RepID=A0A314ZBF4_PRUYE|nr:glucan endo-1 3-beta-glucosidase 2 [Prunus yedoensis var. nudiflora]